jgi:hypothetical protein
MDKEKIDENIAWNEDLAYLQKGFELDALCRRVWCTRDAHKAKEGKEIKPHEMVIVVNGFRDSDDEDLHRYISY